MISARAILIRDALAWGQGANPLASRQQQCCNRATMSQSLTLPVSKWPPRWWRSAQVYVRRANIFPWLLGVAIACFLAASLSAFLVVSDQSDKGQLLPSALTTTLLVGMLVPGMAILMLIGRLLALRRAAPASAARGACMSSWCSSSR
jgi:hypothetical protein